MTTADYNEDRFYRSTITFLTKYVETVQPTEADPKVVAEVVKALLNMDIKPANLDHLSESDPAFAAAAKFAKDKAK